MHLRSYVPPHTTLVVLDGRQGIAIAPLSNAASQGGNARRIGVDPYVRQVTSMRLRSVELPLSFTQFSAARGNTAFALGADLTTGFGGVLHAIPDGNYTTDKLVSKLDEAASVVLDFDVSSTYTDYRGIVVTGGPLRMTMRNKTANAVNVLFAVHQSGCAVSVPGSLNRDLPASQLGWALGFRLAAYTIPPSGTITAEAGVTTQPLRSALVRVAANPAFLRGGFQAAQAGETLAKVLLPPSELFGADGNTESSDRLGAILCATEANGLLQSGTRVFRDTATVPNTPASGAEIRQLDIEILDEFGRALDLQGDTFSMTIEMTHG